MAEMMSMKISNVSTHKANFMLLNFENFGYKDQEAIENGYDKFTMIIKFPVGDKMKFMSIFYNLLNSYVEQDKIITRFNNNY